MEYIQYLITQIHKNNLNDVDRFLNGSENVLKNSKNNKNLEKYLSDLKNIYYECKKLKIDKLDLHIDNVGVNHKNNLVLFDLRNFGEEKISENVDMIKI